MRKVLVVEDEKSLRELLRIVLAQGGHMVLAAETAKEGIHLLLKHARDLDVLICDLGLPDMPAANVASVARAANPQVKVLIISGAPEEPTQTVSIAAPYRFFAKPFSAADVLDFVNGT